MINSASFVSNVARITSGSFFGQSVIILSSPIIARIYEPEIFGLFAIYNAIVRLISAISPLRYEMAIIIAEKNKDVKYLAIISLTFVFILVAIFSQVPIVFNYFNFSSKFILLVSKYPIIISLGILFSGIVIVLLSINNRLGHFSDIASFKFIKPVTTSIFHIIYGLFIKATAFGLFIGDIIGSLIGLIYLSLMLIKRPGLYSLRNVKISRGLFLLKRYKNFPIYGTWNVLVNSLMLQLPVIIISYYFSVTIVGYYALSNRLLQMPMSIFNSGVSQVFLKNAVDNRLSSDIGILVTKMLSRLIMIGIFPLILLGIIGQDLFTIVFGKQWVDAGLYAQILTLWCFSAFLVAPLGQLVNVYEKQKESLFINIMRLLIRLGTLVYFAIITSDILITLTMFSFSGFISNMIFLFWLLRLSNSLINQFFNSLIKYTIFSIIFSLPLIISILFFNISGGMKIIISSVIVFLYFTYIISTDSGLRLLLRNAFNLKK